MSDSDAELAQKLDSLRARFAESLSGRLAEIEAAMRDLAASPDRTALETLVGLAHNIAGTAGTFGFADVGAGAVELDNLGSAIIAEDRLPHPGEIAEMESLVHALRAASGL